MTNISCPQCGAENPLQSKYCNRCGASFRTETTHICPECSSSNPINLLYCDNCGTRLVDDSAPARDEDNGDEAENKRLNRSEPFSLPERPPGQTGNLDVSSVLPDWLKTGDFSGDPGQDEGEDLPWLRAAQGDEVWTDDEAPTLEELSQDHAPRDDLPTWLLDEETAGAIFSGDKSTDELFMSSAGDNDDTDKEQSDDQPPDPEETAAELQGWLNDLDSEEPIQAAEDDGTIEPETALLSSATASLEMPEDDFLQWLSQIQQDTVDREMEPPGEGSSAPVFQDEFPEETGSPEESQEEPDNEGDLDNGPQELEPDWLLGLSEDEIAPEPTGTIGQETSEAPDWLIEPLEEESKEVEDFIGLNDQASFNLEDAMSEWGQISNSAHDASESDTDVSPDSQNDEFLHWLDSLGSGEGATEARESLDTTSTQADSDAQATVVDDPETFSSEDDFKLPDWLGGLSDPGGASDVPESPDIDSLPDWLHDCLLYTSPSPRDRTRSRMPSSA